MKPTDPTDPSEPSDPGATSPPFDFTRLDASVPRVANAHLTGAWSGVFDWPMIGVHSIMLPDGRVLTYGTEAPGEVETEKGQGGFIYDVWDPTLGVGAGAHLTLPNLTPTNIFCSAQLLLDDGTVLITGGETQQRGGIGTVNGGVADVNLFDFRDLSLTPSPLTLTWSRWYPTTTTLPSGEVLLHGGRDQSKDPVNTPEVWSPERGWRLLTGVGSEALYESNMWYYPRSFVMPNGRVLNVGMARDVFWLDPAGEGSVERVMTRDVFRRRGTSVMVRPGVIMLAGGHHNAAAPDATASVEIFEVAGSQVGRRSGGAMASPRRDHDATLLANGEVFVNGGSTTDYRSFGGAVYASEVWNPVTERWTTLASATMPRLYHSSAILLPNGAVLTIGGGRDGPTWPTDPADLPDHLRAYASAEGLAGRPVELFNGEVFYPPYLFKPDGSGELAVRPVIERAPETLDYDRDFDLAVDSAAGVARVTLVALSSTTHSWNMNQRILDLGFDRSGDALRVRSPADANLAPPGFYLVFAIDEAGVPSIARIVKLD